MGSASRRKSEEIAFLLLFIAKASYGIIMSLHYSGAPACVMEIYVSMRRRITSQNNPRPLFSGVKDVDVDERYLDEFLVSTSIFVRDSNLNLNLVKTWRLLAMWDVFKAVAGWLKQSLLIVEWLWIFLVQIEIESFLFKLKKIEKNCEVFFFASNKFIK